MTITRRELLLGSGGIALLGQAAEPRPRFPADVSHRLAVSTYPFRNLISTAKKPGKANGKSAMTLEEFAGTIPDEFGVYGIEPWSEHFDSLESPYLQRLKIAFDKAGLTVVNIPCDARVKPCGSPEESTTALDVWSQWVDAAVALGAPSIRVHLPPITTEPDNLTCALQSLTALAQYGETRNIVINLENDNPTFESPQRILKVVESVKSTWLRTLPDFCNSMLIHNDESENRRQLSELFPHAFNISHVKDVEVNNGKSYRVEVKAIFAIARSSGYRGYFSMEDESTLDPYLATRRLIASARQFLA